MAEDCRVRRSTVALGASEVEAEAGVGIEACACGFVGARV